MITFCKALFAYPKLISLFFFSIMCIFKGHTVKFSGKMYMKILASVEITKGFDSWITVNNKLAPLIEEHSLKNSPSNF